jgi:hypothetical protein
MYDCNGKSYWHYKSQHKMQAKQYYFSGILLLVVLAEPG